MKKILFALLTVCCLALCSCSTNSSYSDDSDYNTYASDTYVVTQSKAEGLATSALYRQLKAHFLYVDKYDISQTRYSIASVTGSSKSGYEVSGTYSIYDKYGNFQKQENFSVSVSSDGVARVTEF